MQYYNPNEVLLTDFFFPFWLHVAIGEEGNTMTRATLWSQNASWIDPLALFFET